MILEIDQDVEAVAEFMQRHIPASKLVAVSDSIKALAPIMWGHFDREKIRALRLLHVPIGEHGQQTQEDAI